MNAIQSERAQLLATLKAARLNALDHLPGRLVPPAALILPGAPYLEPADQFGQTRLRFEVLLVVATGENSTQTKDLDALIVKATAAVVADGWTFGSVAKPGMLASGGGAYLSTSINLSTLVTL